MNTPNICTHPKAFPWFEVYHCPDCDRSFSHHAWEAEKLRVQKTPTSQQTRTLNESNDLPQEIRVQETATPPKNRTLNEIIQDASRLPHSELEELREAIAMLLEVQEVFRGQETDVTPKNRTLKLSLTGSIEFKIINGCGPYRYLRFWSGGKHRSIYYGKADNSQNCP